jgi:protein-tyrosine phosphatase
LSRYAQKSRPAVVVTDVAQVGDWLPLLSGAAARLVRKLGAGPYALQADAGSARGLRARLPAAAVGLVGAPELCVRLSEHPIWVELERADLPLVSIPLSAANAEEAARLVGDAAVCIVDAGATEHKALPSLVRSRGRRCEMVAEGALKRDHFEELTLCRILFICTGNTCRSPMAEALCTKLLCDRLGCTAAEMRANGYVVQSAGLAAMTGSLAATEALDVVASLGGDLSRHQSCMVSLEMLLWADFVFTMTTGHLDTLESVAVPNLPTPRLLSPGRVDIADPIGGTITDYRSCAQQIIDSLNARLPEILEA